MTIYNAKGIYTHESGEVVKENTLRVECYNFNPDQEAAFMEQIKQFVKIVKVSLNQEAVAVEKQESNSFLL